MWMCYICRQRKIKILDDERQTAELSMYEGKVNSKGTVQYNAPVGGNDDMVIALMLALKCKDLKKNKGNYKKQKEKRKILYSDLPFFFLLFISLRC